MVLADFSFVMHEYSASSQGKHYVIDCQRSVPNRTGNEPRVSVDKSVAHTHYEASYTKDNFSKSEVVHQFARKRVRT